MFEANVEPPLRSEELITERVLLNVNRSRCRSRIYCYTTVLYPFITGHQSSRDECYRSIAGSMIWDVTQMR